MNFIGLLIFLTILTIIGIGGSVEEIEAEIRASKLEKKIKKIEKKLGII